MKKLIVFILCLLFATNAFAGYKYNQFTGKLDLYPGQNDNITVNSLIASGTGTSEFEDVEISGTLIASDIMTSNIIITGINISSDNDGAITFSGLGNGFDEDLTFNLDDVSNTVSVSSSTGVASMDFGTLKLISSSNMPTNPKHIRVSIIDPATAYGVASQDCVIPALDAPITISSIEVTCDNDPATEVTGDLKYANNFRAQGNPIVINDFDTTTGVRSDSTITNPNVPAGKAVYLQWDTTPDTAINNIAFDITYSYDK